MIRLAKAVATLDAMLLDDPVSRLLTTMSEAQARIGPLGKLPMKERIERQEAAEFHNEELETEYGPLSRDADFDERHLPGDDE